MPPGKDRRRGKSGAGKGPTATARRKPRPGLPDPAHVVSVKTLTSPKGNRYRIIETDETDAYDPPPDASRKPD